MVDSSSKENARWATKYTNQITITQFISLSQKPSFTMKLNQVVCIIIALNISSSSLNRCRDYEDKLEHEFHPLRHCQRSNKSVIAFANVDSLDECIDFARSMSGLAFNYNPKDRFGKNLYEIKKMNESTADNIETDPDEFYNCEILGCPESRNFSSMVNDTRFDYYSLYTRPPRECE